MKNTRKALVFSAISVASFQACAVDFNWGEGVQGKFSGTVTLGSQMRTESASPSAYADWPSRSVPDTLRGQLQGQTGGSNLNFGQGAPISTVLKTVWELDLKKDHFGVFLRGRAWNDFVLGEKKVAYGNYPNGFQTGQPLSDRGFESSSQFSQAEWHEAYFYADFQAGADATLDARWGRQVLQWGGAVLHTGGINAGVNPSDFSSLLRPGAMPTEGKVPLGMLSLKWAHPPSWHLEGFAAYEARSAVQPGCGTYFDVSSIAPPGCDFAGLAGASEQALLATGNYVHRNADVKARRLGQYGVALGYKAESLDADVKVYAMNTHSTIPSLRIAINAVTPGVRSVNYAMVYPEDVALMGVSYLKKLAPAARVFGEVAYRPHQPVNLNAYDVLSGFVTRSPSSVLALNKGLAAIPAGGTFDAYDRFGVVTGSLGADLVLPKAMGADRVVWLAEVGFSQVNGLPDTSVLRYGRPLPYNGAAYAGGPVCVDAVPGKTCTSDGYISRRAWGWKMLLTARYANAFAGLALTPSVLVAKDVKGYAHDGAYSEGRSLIRPALRAEMGKNYFAEIQYHRFSGGQYNLLTDRDYVSVMAGARF